MSTINDDHHLPELLREALAETDKASLYQTIDRLTINGNVASLSKGLERIDKAINTIQARKILESTKNIRATIGNVLSQVRRGIKK